MPRFVLGLGAAGVGLLAVVAINAARLTSLQPATEPRSAPTRHDAGAVGRLSQALTFRTVLRGAAGTTPHHATAELHALHQFLRRAYPATHQQLTVEPLADLSLLYTWTGSQPSEPPIVLMGHLDVVGVAADEASAWRHPPFAGRIVNGFVWGRGALDDKSSVLATLEAVEGLAAGGFVPRRTIYLAFGHDEETGGHGARTILEVLRGRGIEAFGLVLDEGGAILPAARVPGVTQPVGLIGIAEKRAVTLELTATSTAGHASSPPDVSAIGRLGGALARLEAEPLPARLDDVTARMFRYLAPEMAVSPRLVFSNLWLTAPLVLSVMSRTAGTAPVVRTTMAPTTIRAGDAPNALPGAARATLNVRLLPDDTVEDVIRHITRTVDDPQVTVRQLDPPVGGSPAVADVSAPGFALLANTIRQVYGGDTLVAPYLTIAAVDARWYAAHSRHVYRFRGVRWETDATARIHGVDERIAVDAYLDSIRFMTVLITRANDLPRDGD